MSSDRDYRYYLPEAEAEPQAGSAAPLVPEQLLQPGELILLQLRPGLWYVLLGSLRELGMIGLVMVLALLLESSGWLNVGTRDIVLTAFLFAAVRMSWQFFEWLSCAYVLTDRRVIRLKGVIHVQVFEAQLKQIQHTEATFSLRERLFALGTISFSTAGTSVPDAYWVMIPEPLEVHQKVVQAINRYR